MKEIPSSRVAQRRRLFVSTDIYQMLFDPAAAAAAGFPDAIARALLDCYLGGGPIVMSLCGQSRSDVQFERLENLDEVWVICFRKVSDKQWRLFGRFVKPDIFVAMIPRSRDSLGSRKKYGQAAQDFLTRWSRCYPNGSFVKGSTWPDYVTGPARDICDDDGDAF